MSGAILLLLLVSMSGARLSPGMISMFVQMRRDAVKKWGAILDAAQSVLVAVYFYLRGPQEFKDAAGNPASDIATANLRIEQFQKDFLQQTLVGRTMDALVKTIMALIEPSAGEEALMTALLSGGLFGGGPVGGAPVTVVNQPAPAPAPVQQRTAGEVLQTGPRAQAVYIDQHGRLVAY